MSIVSPSCREGRGAERSSPKPLREEALQGRPTQTDNANRGRAWGSAFLFRTTAACLREGEVAASSSPSSSSPESLRSASSWPCSFLLSSLPSAKDTTRALNTRRSPHRHEREEEEAEEKEREKEIDGFVEEERVKMPTSRREAFPELQVRIFYRATDGLEKTRQRQSRRRRTRRKKKKKIPVSFYLSLQC